MATTVTKIRRKEVQQPWTRIPTLHSQLRTHMQDSQRRTHTGDNQPRTHMHDNQPRIRMLGGKQLRILTMLQRILTQAGSEVNRRSHMTLTEKKMMEVVKKKQLQGEP